MHVKDDKSIDETVNKWGVSGDNKNGYNLVDLSVERGLFTTNPSFKHMIYGEDGLSQMNKKV